MLGTVLVKDLCKTYNVRACKGLFKSEKSTVVALTGLSLEVHPGEIFGLLMPLLGYYLYRRAEDYARATGSLGAF